ncbi:MAG: hypothetical protein Q8Q62_08940 [Mesorhizobium sp.]|nr:hypothetical protein [Mesorhizobium sp.]
MRFLAVLAAAAPASAGEKSVWIAGAYSFSDELGGFLIRGASGTGSKSDPIVIDQEMLSASPVTLVIRAVTPIRMLSNTSVFANGMMHVRLRTLNNSGIAWTEFEFELQEILGKPSTFGDGLSFDQRRSSDENRSSNAFRIHSTDFEPFDRLLFTDGHVDPLDTADFGFFITDFTPKREFYLRQDPRVPLS